MATVQLKKGCFSNYDGPPSGNSLRYEYSLATGSTGAATNSNSSAAIAIGDKIVLGVIPAYARLIDASIIISDAFTASSTINLGFEYEDGVDSTAVPQSATFFGSAVAVSSTGRLTTNVNSRPVTLPKPAKLIATWGGANNAEAGVLDVIINGYQP